MKSLALPPFRIVREQSPFLYRVSLLFFAGALAAAAGIALDPRELLGINVWVKPLKFLISVGIYTLTVGYLIQLYPYTDTRKHWLRNIVTLSLLLEIAIIVYQAYRGVPSHFNISTAWDAALFQSMGILIGINVLIMAVFAVDALRLRLLTSRPMQYAIALGWLVVIFGSAAGGQMAAQLSHSIGVADGGPGLPLLNWSTLGGDLRVAHFFGLHAIQLIPLCALLLHRLGLRLQAQLTGVWLFALAYAGWVGFTYYQALQGLALVG